MPAPKDPIKLAEFKRKLSEKFKIIAKEKGFGKWMKGKKLSKETKKKIGSWSRNKTYQEIYGDRAEKESLKRKLGNRERWIGKKKNDLRPKHNGDYQYIEWRKKVFERDSYTCQICLIKGGYLEAHHIKSWKNYPELRYVIKNGITTHKGECHQMKNNETRSVERLEAIKEANSENH